MKNARFQQIKAAVHALASCLLPLASCFSLADHLCCLKASRGAGEEGVRGGFFQSPLKLKNGRKKQRGVKHGKKTNYDNYFSRVKFELKTFIL